MRAMILSRGRAFAIIGGVAPQFEGEHGFGQRLNSRSLSVPSGIAFSSSRAAARDRSLPRCGSRWAASRGTISSVERGHGPAGTPPSRDVGANPASGRTPGIADRFLTLRSLPTACRHVVCLWGAERKCRLKPSARAGRA
jgi:hypothetical protein